MRGACGAVAFVAAVLAMATTARADAPTQWSVHGFADFYYGVDSNDASANRRPDFLYNHTRTDAPQLNLGLLQVAASARQLRGNLGLMVGSYGEENLALEPDWAKHVFEANVGLALSAAQEAWLDVGILPSHLGFESALSSRNATLTRSLAAENSPYYLTGARVSGRAGPRWTLAALLVTGWQRTAPVDGNSLPGVGTQVAYAASDALSFNWSTFIGTDDPDDARRMRYFNNVYALYAPSRTLDFTLGLDVGLQQAAPDADDYDIWFTPQLVARYRLGGPWTVAARVEYYHDPRGVIVSAASGSGTHTWGLSCNLDRRFGDHVLARVEARHLQDPARNFARGEQGFSDRSTSLLASLAVEF